MEEKWPRVSEIQSLLHEVSLPGQTDLWAAYTPAVTKNSGEPDRDSSPLGTSYSTRWTGKDGILPGCGMVSSLPIPGTWSSPKTLSLPTTNAIKCSREALQGQPSVVSNLTSSYRLTCLWSPYPCTRSLCMVDVHKGRRKGGSEEIQERLPE